MHRLRPPIFFDYALLVLLGVMFGSSFLLMKIAVETVPTFHVVFFRLVVAFLVLYAFLKIKRFSFPALQEKHFWRTSVVLGLTANIIPFSLITWAEKEINSGLAGIYMTTIPVFSLLLAHLLTEDEKISTKKIIGVCVAFFGVVVLLWKDVGDISVNLLSQIACIVSSAFYAYSRIKTKELGDINPVVISAGVLLCGILSMFPFILFFGNSANIMPSSQSIIAIILLGIFPTALAFVILYKLIHDVGAVFMTSVNYLVPVFALLWGYFVLSELINKTIIASMMLIVTGVFFVSRR